MLRSALEDETALIRNAQGVHLLAVVLSVVIDNASQLIRLSYPLLCGDILPCFLREIQSCPVHLSSFWRERCPSVSRCRQVLFNCLHPEDHDFEHRDSIEYDRPPQQTHSSRRDY